MPSFDLPFYTLIMLGYVALPVPALAGAILFGAAGYRLSKRRRLAVAMGAALAGSLVSPWALILLVAPFVEGDAHLAPSGNATRLVGVAFLLGASLGIYALVRWLKRPPRV